MASCADTSVEPIRSNNLASTENIHSALSAVDHEAARLCAADAPESDWVLWDERAGRVWAEVEALPESAANAIIKARAVWSICAGDLSLIADSDTTCGKLLRQIVSGLNVGAHA